MAYNNRTDKQTSEVLNESREVLYGQDKSTDSITNNILEFMTKMDSRLKNIETSVTKSVTELDEIKTSINSINLKVSSVQREVVELTKKHCELEQNTQGISDMFDSVQKQCSENSKAITGLDKDSNGICSQMSMLQEELKSFKLEREEMKETILDLRCRSMKNNLIFTGLMETERESTEVKLRDFLRHELGIDYHIEFGNVHRFGSRMRPGNNNTNTKHRPIVARFIYYSDLQYVLENAKFLKGKPFGINQQFPSEIENRRRELYPVMKEAKHKGAKVKMVRDKLYINNAEYASEENRQQNNNTMNFRGALMSTPVDPRQRYYGKRQRVGSTPDQVGLRPPQNVNTIIKDNNATFTWTLPSKAVIWTRLDVYYGTSSAKIIRSEDVEAPKTSYHTKVLSPCEQYTVKLQSINRAHHSAWSDFVKITFRMTVVTGLSQPQNVNIAVKGKNVTFTWTLPSESVTSTYLDVFNGNGTSITKVISENITSIRSSFTTLSDLLPCQQYTAKLQTGNGCYRSKVVEKTFWTTEQEFTSDIYTDVNLIWTTGLQQFYTVSAPSLNIYSVIGGSISPNTDKPNYKINTKLDDLQHINVSVLNVTQNDSGLYKTVNNEKVVNGCCLLVITDKPTKPLLTYDKYPFVGFQIVFTCKSEVRRWPADPTSSLSYNFSAMGEQHTNMLTINVTKSNKEIRVYCQARDDKSKTSESSNNMILDPYYGPVSVSISPPSSHVDVTEGEKLHPITCSADCNPNCNYVWKNITNGGRKKFKDGKILNIDSIARKHNGTYRCRVTHPNRTIRETYPNGSRRFLVIDVNVNVLYPPSFKSLEIGKDTNSFRHYRSEYQLKEEDRVLVRMYIESNPNSHLYFYSHSFHKKKLKYNVSNNDYTTELPSLKCEDSGQYTIEANNSIKNSTKKRVHLIIQCKPKNIKTERQTIGTQLDALENVTITVVANPKPTVRWLNNTGLPWEWEVKQSSTYFNYKLTSAVQIKDESQFGQYRVRIDNSVGNAIVNITLTPKDKPQQPHNVSVDIFVNKANISWVAGFDGGDKQSFSIKYKQSNERIFETIDLIQTGIKKETALSYTFTELTPNTHYDVCVIAKNSYGERNKSIEFKTLVAPVPLNKSGGPRNAIIFSVVGLLALIIVIILAFVFIRHRRRNSQNRTGVKDRKVEYAAVDKTNERRQIGATGNSAEMVETEYANVGESSRNVGSMPLTASAEDITNVLCLAILKRETDENDIYENQGTSQMDDAEKTGRIQNDDGLTYIEVSFSKNKSDQKPIIRGIEDKTTYMDIDFTRRAEPLQEEFD